jgi:hypothetical protein
MSSNMRGGWKVNATEYNHQMSLEAQYRETNEWRAKNNFGIYWVILAIILLAVFA